MDSILLSDINYHYAAKVFVKGVKKMKNIDLTKYGITGTTEIVYNPSY